MRKAEFITELANKADLSEQEAEQITEAFLSILTDSWSKKIPIHFRGFGTFDIRETNERVARNPKTMEDVVIPAGYKPIFHASKRLREEVNDALKAQECEKK